MCVESLLDNLKKYPMVNPNYVCVCVYPFRLGYIYGRALLPGADWPTTRAV